MNDDSSISGEALYELVLTRRQIALIRDETFYPEPEELLGVVDRRGVRLHLPLWVYEDMQGHVAAAANHCKDRKLQGELDKLFDRLEDFLDSVA